MYGKELEIILKFDSHNKYIHGQKYGFVPSRSAKCKAFAKHDALNYCYLLNHITRIFIHGLIHYFFQNSVPII